MRLFCRFSAVLLFVYMFMYTTGTAQPLKQTVRGVVVDADTRLPLPGAQVVLQGVQPLRGTATDADGLFRIDGLPVGRHTLAFSYLGYESAVIADLLLISGKETVLEVGLKESLTSLNEVVVTAGEGPGAALHELALVSARSISPDETNRYAGGFNDPARILSNFAGVNNSQDGSADIIVRGNAPKYLQWRVEGMEIPSPNHFGDPAGLGTNGVSMLNNNLLSTSDFFTGAFTADYGDVLSGVYDVKLRAGNNEHMEGIAGVGVLGTDLTLEGPLNKEGRGSLLANYRFTTIALADKMGLLQDLGGIPSFSDAAFKLHVPTKNHGTFSVFGLGGRSSIAFEDVSHSIWRTPGNRGMRADISEDFSKKAFMVNAGISHHLPIDAKSYLSWNLGFSRDGIEDGIVEHETFTSGAQESRDNFKSRINGNTVRAGLTWHRKHSARTIVEAGMRGIFRTRNMEISALDSTLQREYFVDMKASANSYRSYVMTKHRFSENLSATAGFHHHYVAYNGKMAYEPRFGLAWTPGNGHAFSLGAGQHSTMEALHHYEAQVVEADGALSRPNRSLDLLKARHLVGGYEYRGLPGWRFKFEAYTQHLYDLPVDANPSSSFATINETLEFRTTRLVNAGKGRNSGVEITLEKYFSKNYYLLFNATVYDSKYTALDGKTRNTAFNNRYLVNALAGKEFHGLGRKRNNTFAINGKVFTGGGRPIVPLLRDENGAVDVDPEQNRYYDEGRAFSLSLDRIFTLTLAVSYKWNRLNRTSELFLNIENLTNNKPRLSEFYDPEAAGNVGHLTPLGVFPNMMYRLYF
jgi:hypothetical protein